MIDSLIVSNLTKKFNREFAKGNLEEARKVIERLEKIYQEHEKDELGTQLYFAIRGMKKILWKK